MSCLEYIIEKGFRPEKVGRDTYRVNPCPFCGHNDTFTIFDGTDSWYCFSEGIGGGLQQLKIAFGEGEIRQEAEDYTSFIYSLHDYVSRTDYYRLRGLKDTIDRYKLGYSPTGLNCIFRAKTVEGEEFYNAYKYILPFWDSNNRCYYFIARRDEESAKSFREKYRRDIPKTFNPPNKPARIFNERYLDNPPEMIFIVEGIFDALSLEEDGYPAIALNSVSNFNKFLELCRRKKDKLQNVKFVLIPDNDTAGERLIKHFTDEFIFNVKIIKLPDCKDANDYLIKHGELRETVEELLSRDDTVFWVADYIGNFLNAIGNQRMISTGLNKLDEALGGGLRSGLTIFGGLTSLGKTSFAILLAYNMVSEVPVFYFALEEARLDLMAKLFGLTSYTYGLKISTLDILRGNFQIPEEDFLLIVEKFKDIGERIAIFEGNFTTNVLNIRDEIERFVSATGKTPAVIVDYIQILKPPDLNFRTDKQALDFSVSELKRIARDFNTVVIGISSINRGSYDGEFTYEALKESGGIEYTADVLLGLQIPTDDKREPKKNIAEKVRQVFKKEPVALQIKILKNRYGPSHQTVDIKFYPRYSYYEE